MVRPPVRLFIPSNAHSRENEYCISRFAGACSGQSAEKCVIEKGEESA